MLEGLDKPIDILSLLNCPHVQDNLLPLRSGRGRNMDAVMHDANARAFHSEQLLDLRGGEFGHSDDAFRLSAGAPGLLGQTPPELRRGVVCSEHEQIMKRSYGMPQAAGGQPLIEPVKDVCSPGSNRLL